jgi:hypothetical protein
MNCDGNHARVALELIRDWKSESRPGELGPNRDLLEGG